MNSPEIFVDLRPHANCVDLFLHQGDGWMKEPIFQKVKEGETPPVGISHPMVEAQALMDRLWSAGLRPTEGAGSAGALSATQQHLEDMRKIVFETCDPRHTAREIIDAIRRETVKPDPDMLRQCLTPAQERKMFDP